MIKQYKESMPRVSKDSSKNRKSSAPELRRTSSEVIQSLYLSTSTPSTHATLRNFSPTSPTAPRFMRRRSFLSFSQEFKVENQDVEEKDTSQKELEFGKPVNIQQALATSIISERLNAMNHKNESTV